MQTAQSNYSALFSVWHQTLRWYNCPTPWVHVVQRFGYNARKWGIVMKMLERGDLQRFHYRHKDMVCLTTHGLERAADLMEIPNLSGRHGKFSNCADMAVKVVILTNSVSGNETIEEAEYLKDYDLNTGDFAVTSDITMALQLDPNQTNAINALYQKWLFKAAFIITTVD